MPPPTATRGAVACCVLGDVVFRTRHAFPVAVARSYVDVLDKRHHKIAHRAASLALVNTARNTFATPLPPTAQPTGRCLYQGVAVTG